MLFYLNIQMVIVSPKVISLSGIDYAVHYTKYCMMCIM